MAQGVLPVQDPTHQGHSRHERSRILDQAIRARGHHHRLQTFPATVCRFNHPSRNSQLTISPTQTKLPTPGLQPGTGPSNTNSQIHTVTMKARPTVERPYQRDPSVRIWMEKPVPARSRRPRDAVPRHQPPFSPHLPSPVNMHDPREVETQLLPNELRRSPSRSLQYPLTTSRFMKAMTKTRRVSRATVTVMKSVSAKWWLAIMTPVRVNGSICRVWA